MWNFRELVALCPISYTISLMEGRWKPLVIDLLLKRPMRYSELKKSISLITERVLTLQLKELEQDGLITKVIYKEKSPKIVEYRISDKGEILKGVLTELFLWGKANRAIDLGIEIKDDNSYISKVRF